MPLLYNSDVMVFFGGSSYENKLDSFSSFLQDAANDRLICRTLHSHPINFSKFSNVGTSNLNSFYHDFIILQQLELDVFAN